MNDYLEDATTRDQIGFQLGTQLATILYVPVNFTALIYGFRYIANMTGAGTVVGELRTQRLGTLTGTIDVISVQPGSEIRDGAHEHPIARGNAGEYIVGVVLGPSTGSIEGSMIYSYAPGRISSD